MDNSARISFWYEVMAKYARIRNVCRDRNECNLEKRSATSKYLVNTGLVDIVSEHGDDWTTEDCWKVRTCSLGEAVYRPWAAAMREFKQFIPSIDFSVQNEMWRKFREGEPCTVIRGCLPGGIPRYLATFLTNGRRNANHRTLCTYSRSSWCFEPAGSTRELRKVPEWSECSLSEVNEFDLCRNVLGQKEVPCTWIHDDGLNLYECFKVYRGRKYCAPKLDFRHPERRLFEDSIEKVLGIDLTADDVLNDIGGRILSDKAWLRTQYPRFSAAVRRIRDVVLAEGVACA